MQSNTALAYEPTAESEYTTGESFADLFEKGGTEQVRLEGNVVRGVVIDVTDDFVTVDVGLKSEGRIPVKEFTHTGRELELKIGDEVEVYIERVEDRHGEAVLSREKALREESWVRLERSWMNGERVEGVIFGRVKGGFTVDIDGAVAFLPGSQVDIRPIRDIGPLMHVKQPFQILKMDRRRGNIVVSRRAILEESRVEARNELLDKIAEGQVLEGMVKNITDYGAFIDMGGVDGLLHVTDISWKRINHPSEVFAVGDTIKVMVTKYDQETKRISLGMKQLESNPWEGVQDRFPVGARLTGKVTNITDYGAFVELATGIEGLVHVSEMSWTKKNTHPSKIVSHGMEVEVTVLDVEPNKHRISLGIKQCAANPWQAFADKYPVGSDIEGEIRNITDFGLFVGLEGEIDGLVHHSDVSWDVAGEEAIKAYKKGETIKARVLLIDLEKERISLGIKQLSESKTVSKLDGFKKGDVVTCTVAEVNGDGIEVTLKDGITAYIKKAELARERQEQRTERFAVGDRVDAKITAVEKSLNKVSLSIKALEVEQHKKAIEDYGSSDSGASLGDILGAALSEAATDKAKKKPKAKKAAAESEDEA